MAAPQILWFALPVLFVVARLLVNAFSVLVWKPFRIQRTLRAQGITGPPYKILVGNLRDIAALTKAARAAPLPHVTHNIMSRVMPQHITWSSQYGIPFVYWLGYKPRVTLTDPELCRDILVNKFGQYPKPAFPSELQDLFAKGLVTLEGEKWAQHRRIVSPAFFVEKLKAMVPTIAHLAKEMVLRWNSGLEGGASKEMDVAEEFKTLTADIIAHTAFGSSFAEGKRVFELQYEQQRLFTKLSTAVQVPGVRSLEDGYLYVWSLRASHQIVRHVDKVYVRECRQDSIALRGVLEGAVVLGWSFCHGNAWKSSPLDSIRRAGLLAIVIDASPKPGSMVKAGGAEILCNELKASWACDELKELLGI